MKNFFKKKSEGVHLFHSKWRDQPLYDCAVILSLSPSVKRACTLSLLLLHDLSHTWHVGVIVKRLQTTKYISRTESDRVNTASFKWWVLEFIFLTFWSNDRIRVASTGHEASQGNLSIHQNKIIVCTGGFNLFDENFIIQHILKFKNSNFFHLLFLCSFWKVEFKADVFEVRCQSLFVLPPLGMNSLSRNIIKEWLRVGDPPPMADLRMRQQVEKQLSCDSTGFGLLYLKKNNAHTTFTYLPPNSITTNP